MIIICFLIAIIATTIGASSGIGGGVIIKPVLESFNMFDLKTVTLLSSITIFSMAVVSLIKQIKMKDPINFKTTVTIALGSTLGGVLGEKLLKFMLSLSSNSKGVSILQSLMLIFLLAVVYVYINHKDKLKEFKVKSLILIFVVGLILGALASFLGIGGGPINVAIFALLFSMNTKDAARNSIILIFFSQGAKILSIALTTGFSSYNLKVMPYMIVGGVLGGFLGYKLNKSVSDKFITRLFNIVLIFIILVNIYNLI
ncbi:MAG: TSUP family transporter [Clostridium sp.]|uniref:sulfite exporter TauE/SafE family protein n=1 Tax=Clostridium sp. LY3-2 TaxID=2942482 RepID=UPI0021529E3A|nr:sulfite exporter TauE/SafE family protein [Clostridium sp. LY3-2]MCR6516221.1 sulfite exporter TauE/SafE family protein [Clostridium sp. LY3-2]